MGRWLRIIGWYLLLVVALGETARAECEVLADTVDATARQAIAAYEADERPGFIRHHKALVEQLDQLCERVSAAQAARIHLARMIKYQLGFDDLLVERTLRAYLNADPAAADYGASERLQAQIGEVFKRVKYETQNESGDRMRAALRPGVWVVDGHVRQRAIWTEQAILLQEVLEVDRVKTQYLGSQMEAPLVVGVRERGGGQVASGKEWAEGRVKTYIQGFETEPAGASVHIDGEVLCEATPCSKAVLFGRHELTIVMADADPVLGDLYVRANETHSFKLVSRGLKLGSHDEATRCSIDDDVLNGNVESALDAYAERRPERFEQLVAKTLENLEQACSVLSPRVSSKIHLILAIQAVVQEDEGAGLAALQGYVRADPEADLKGDLPDANTTLESLMEQASAAEPSVAALAPGVWYVDGASSRGVLPVGRNAVVQQILAGGGYQNTYSRGGAEELAVQAPSEASPGAGQYKLDVETKPAGAQLSVGRIAACKTPCSRSFAGGLQQIEIVSDGYAPVHGSVYLGGDEKLVVELVPAAGWLSVLTEPGGLTVRVDGKAAGPSPVEELQLQAGAHTIGLDELGWTIQPLDVELKVAERRSITLKAEKVMGGLDVAVSDSDGNDLVKEILIGGELWGSAPAQEPIQAGEYELRIGPHTLDKISVRGQTWTEVRLNFDTGKAAINVRGEGKENSGGARTPFLIGSALSAAAAAGTAVAALAQTKNISDGVDRASIDAAFARQKTFAYISYSCMGLTGVGAGLYVAF